MSVTQSSCMFSNASAIVHSACSMLAFHNFPAAPPLKTTREKLSAHTEGNHTCSQPAASKLELNRIKSTAVPSSHRFSPPADQCLEVELRLVSTRGQAWSAPLCPTYAPLRSPWPPMDRSFWSPGPGWSTPPSTSGPTRSGCRRRVGGSGTRNWLSRIMPESMIGRCMRRAELSDACGGEGCMWRGGI